MKKYIKTIVSCCIIALAFSACETKEIGTFSGKDVIYFQWAVDGREVASQKIDSTAISFALELPTEVLDSLVLVPVKVQGFTSTEDRSVSVSIMESSTAEQGVHFTVADNIVIPANEYVGYVPVTFNRTEDMKEQIYSLKIQLLENENFETTLFGTDTNYGNSDKTLSYTEFEITVSDMLTEPDRWYSLEKYIGAFSVKKFYLFAEVNQMDLPNYNVIPVWGEFYGHIAVFKAYLEAQANAGTPVLEEDGSLMTLGPNA
jgi:hypothetical protein